jgi:PAS domain S-box-containing protein
MHWSLENKIRAGFLLALVVLGVMAVISYRSIRELVQNANTVSQTNAVLAELEATFSALKDAESGARGYVLTGDRAFLSHYDQALADARDHVSRLRRMFADNPQQRQRLEAILPKLEDRLDISRNAIVARQVQGFEAARDMVASGVGLQKMEEIRTALSEIEQHERTALARQVEESRQSAERTIFILFLLAMLALLFVLLAHSRISRDIRLRHEVEQAIADQKNWLQTTISSIGDAVIATDIQRLISVMNPEAERLTGWQQSDAIGKPVAMVFVLAGGSEGPAQGGRSTQERQEEPARQMENPLEEVLLSGHPVASEQNMLLESRNGASIPIGYLAAPIRDGAGQVLGAVLVFRDLTQQRMLEVMKDEFISTVSHELRTPLTSIRGALGLLASGRVGELPPKGKRMTEIALENSERLARLVNDILDIERINAGRITLELKGCDARQLAEQAMHGVQDLAERSGVSIEQNVPQATVEADEDRIVQVMTNLLGNAVKFSSSGDVVEFSAHPCGPELLFMVRDHGRGIPESKLASIFERFQQVDASDSRQKGGTGLGLTISRAIVEQHHGRIWAESELGAGSTFYFTLPMPEADASAPSNR